MFEKVFGVVRAVHAKITDFVVGVAQVSPVDVGTLKSQYPYGLPVSTKPLILIGRQGYVVGYDSIAKIPAFVCYTLIPTHTVGELPRVNPFATDYSLPSTARTTVEDYRGNGWDMGHNTPCEDQSWSPQTEKESFILSNMTPQAPGLNRGRWKVLEVTVRAWAWGLNHELNIITGPIYDSTCKTIGTDKVTIPSGYFKIVIDTVTQESLAFEYVNTDQGDDEIEKAQVAVSDIEAKTGLHFLMPGDKMAKLAIWPVNVGAYNKARTK